MLKLFLRSSGYLLAGLAFLILFYASIVFAGWWTGKNRSEEAFERELAAEVDRQLTLAQQDVDNGNLGLAGERLAYLEENAADNEAVIQLALRLEQADSPIQVAAAPTRELPNPVVVISAGDVTATSTPILPTATPAATATPTRIPPTPRPERIEQQLGSIERAIESERWEEAIADLVSFQLTSPSYERFYTDSLLYEAYVGGGFAFTNSNRVTLGINYFEQAEKLGELPEEAVSQLYYSRSYLTAMSYYGIDWPRSVNRLDEICRVAPQFQNSCDLLFNARDAWGDQLADAADSCGAAEQYRLALQLGSSGDVAQKHNTTKWKCQNATPTPWPSGG